MRAARGGGISTAAAPGLAPRALPAPEQETPDVDLCLHDGMQEDPMPMVPAAVCL